MKKAVILVSGGIDSATVLAMVRGMDYEIHALSFNYAQRHLVELDKVRAMVKDYQVTEHKIINIDLTHFYSSALIDHNLQVPHYKEVKDLAADIPITYVPARNTIFLSYALGFAEVIAAYDIFIGVHATDYANYPDCRPEYIMSFQTMANLATKMGIDTRGNINIHAPLIKMSKSDIVKKGLELGVDYAKTISCYDPTADAVSCGKCHACLLRLDAFLQNKVTDPISYVTLK